MKKLIYLVMIAFFSVTLMSMVIEKPWPTTPEKYVKMKATKATPESIQLGKDLYLKKCKACHGEKGQKNFEELKTLKDGDKYYRTFVGNSDMPSFEKKIPVESDRWAVIHYLNTFK